MKLTICWNAKGRKKDIQEAIRAKFNIPSYMSVNCETPCEIKDEQLPLLRECEKRGFIQIRIKKQ